LLLLFVFPWRLTKNHAFLPCISHQPIDAPNYRLFETAWRLVDQLNKLMKDSYMYYRRGGDRRESEHQVRFDFVFTSALNLCRAVANQSHSFRGDPLSWNQFLLLAAKELELASRALKTRAASQIRRAATFSIPRTSTKPQQLGTQDFNIETFVQLVVPQCNHPASSHAPGENMARQSPGSTGSSAQPAACSAQRKRTRRPVSDK